MPMPTSAAIATSARTGVRSRWSVVFSGGRRTADSRRPARSLPVGLVLWWRREPASLFWDV